MDKITFDEFKKVELRVVKVIEAERVEGSEKLLKLQVDLGMEKRQIIAGIGKFYDPESLIGKEIAIVVNLESRQLMGLESQGMVLCASDENTLVFLTPEKEVSAGAEIK